MHSAKIGDDDVDAEDNFEGDAAFGMLETLRFVSLNDKRLGDDSIFKGGEDIAPERVTDEFNRIKRGEGKDEDTIEARCCPDVESRKRKGTRSTHSNVLVSSDGATRCTDS